MAIRDNIAELLDLLEKKPRDPAVLETLFEAIKVLRSDGEGASGDAQGNTERAGVIGNAGRKAGGECVNRQADGDVTTVQDAVVPDNVTEAHRLNKLVRRESARMVSLLGDELTVSPSLIEQKKVELMQRFATIYDKGLLFDASAEFEAYLLYVDGHKPAQQRFYLPRRHYLKRVVAAYQRVLDGELDFLSVSLLKRGGKSQTGINFVNMVSGRNPNGSTLMEGAGDALVKSFYSGSLEMLSPEYRHYDVFPESKIVSTSADIKTINLKNKTRFPTIMCRSIDATQVGLSEATNVLYLDDCVEGREEAKDRNRLDKRWETISGDVLGRRLEGTPIVACGTRYSLYDPIGRLQEKAVELGWRWEAVEIPALDRKTDESNYEHTNREGKRIFTTEYLRNERKLLSDEQWESEFQQQPFEAKGLMFPERALKRFFELPPDRDPDTVMAVCDTAEKGADSVMLPIAYLYGEDVFILDCVFDNSPPQATKPQVAKKLFDHKVSTATFESNNAGEYYARDVADLLKTLGGRTSIRTKRTISNKHTRIEMASDGILEHFYFLDESIYKPDSQYGQMMRELTTYTRTGKVAHDDAPDGMSLLENEIRVLMQGTAKAEVRRRPF